MMSESYPTSDQDTSTNTMGQQDDNSSAKAGTPPRELNNILAEYDGQVIVSDEYDWD